MKTLICLVALFLSGCATLDDLERDAVQTGDWSKYDARLETLLQRQEAAEEFEKSCSSPVCYNRCVALPTNPMPGDSGRPRDWRCSDLLY